MIARITSAHLVICAAIILLLSGCTQSLLKKQAITAKMTIPVSDPILRQVTGITQHAQLSASGQFAEGTYVIKGFSVRVEPNTAFRIDLAIPVDNPDSISTENASGTLTTSRPLSIDNIVAPKTIELKNGKATGDVDIVRIVGAYFINVLEQQLSSDSPDDVRQMIAHMRIDKASFDLRPDSVGHFGKNILHLAEGSHIELTDLDVDPSLNYEGNGDVILKFLPGCVWIGERVDCDFDGGEAHLLLKVRRQNHRFILALAESTDEFTLKECIFKFGKNKRSSTHSAACDLDLSGLDWVKPEGSRDAELHLKSKMLLSDTWIDIKTQVEETRAHFPSSVATNIQFDSDANGRQTKFSSEKMETASEARIEIAKPPTTVAISLLKAKIGPIALDKFGDLEFNLRHGNAKLKELDWSNGAKRFTLKTAGSADLEVPKGMSLSIDQDAGQTTMDLPIEIHLGEAKLAGKNTEIKLGNINGTLAVNVGKDVRIRSDMDFTVEQSDLFGADAADVKARGFSLESHNGDAVAHMDNCTVLINDDAIEQSIRDELPNNKVFHIDKCFEDRKWRYRNMTVKTVTVHQLTLEEASQDAPNVLSFSVAGDVVTDGTVDKAHLLDAFSQTPKWETKPWSASAHCNGNGTVAYTLVPGKSLADSQLRYKISMNLPIPDDVKLDWTQVTDGLARTAERAVIVSHLSKITIPINYASKAKIFASRKKQLSSIRVSHMVVRPAPTGCEMSFTADADL
ncbi:MAG TPA: hypothetical protein V6C81_23245 [Planktothrix sp.]